MSWQLDIRPPDGGTIRTTYTHETPGGITGGFEWSRRADGHCIQLTFHSTGSDIHPRDVLDLTINETNLFRGAVVRCPHNDDLNGGEVVATAEALLSASQVPDVLTSLNNDVASIAGFVASFSHPALNAPLPGFPNTGKVLERARLSFIPLDQALESLAETVPGVTFGVLPGGNMFFQEPSGNRDVSYTTASLKWIPLDAQDIATAVTVVVAGQNQNEPDEVESNAGTVSQLYRMTAQATYEHELHDTYHAHTSAELSPGVEPFESRYAPDTNIFANGDNAWDGDLSTFAYNSLDNSEHIIEYDVSLPARRVMGIRIVYRCTIPPGDARIAVEYRTAADRFIRARWGLIQSSSNQVLEAIFLPPFDQDYNEAIVGLRVPLDTLSGEGADTVRIYDIQPLILDEDMVKDMAASKVKLPAQVPREITVHGIVEPAKQVTITGAPGGDISGDAREFRYEHTAERTVTRIFMEQSDTRDDARLLRIIPERMDRKLANRLRPILFFGRR